MPKFLKAMFLQSTTPCPIWGSADVKIWYMFGDGVELKVLSLPVSCIAYQTQNAARLTFVKLSYLKGKNRRRWCDASMYALPATNVEKHVRPLCLLLCSSMAANVSIVSACL